MSEGAPKPQPSPENKEGYIIPTTHSATEDSIGIPYTDRERSRLSVYAHILDRTSVAKKDLIEHRDHRLGFLDPQGNMVETILTYDTDFIDRWNKQAQQILDDEFKGKEYLENAAQDLKRQVKEKHEGVKTMDTQQLSDLWNREY